MSGYGKGDRFQPFSNGGEFRMWLAHNCAPDRPKVIA